MASFLLPATFCVNSQLFALNPFESIVTEMWVCISATSKKRSSVFYSFNFLAFEELGVKLNKYWFTVVVSFQSNPSKAHLLLVERKFPPETLNWKGKKKLGFQNDWFQSGMLQKNDWFKLIGGEMFKRWQTLQYEGEFKDCPPHTVDLRLHKQ